MDKRNLAEINTLCTPQPDFYTNDPSSVFARLARDMGARVVDIGRDGTSMAVEGNDEQ